MKPHFKRQSGVWTCTDGFVMGVSMTVAECWASYKRGVATITSILAEADRSQTLH